jgi:hypothetical protein
MEESELQDYVCSVGGRAVIVALKELFLALKKVIDSIFAKSIGRAPPMLLYEMSNWKKLSVKKNRNDTYVVQKT